MCRVPQAAVSFTCGSRIAGVCWPLVSITFSIYVAHLGGYLIGAKMNAEVEGGLWELTAWRARSALFEPRSSLQNRLDAFFIGQI